MRLGVVAALSCSLLVACGKAETDKVENSSTPGAVTAEAEKPNPVVQAIKCEQHKGQSAPKGQQADDVLGLRPGMALAKVRVILVCNDPQWTIQDQSTLYRMESGSADVQILMANLQNPDRIADDNLKLTFVGSGGSAQLYLIQRNLRHINGKPPILISRVKEDISRKYGRFDGDAANASGIIVHLASGERLGPENSQYELCEQSLGNWEASHKDYTLCGLGLRYDISAEDELSVRQYSIAIGNVGEMKAALKSNAAARAAQIQSEGAKQGTPAL